MDNNQKLIDEVDRELVDQDIDVSMSQVRKDHYRSYSKMWTKYVNN